MKKQDIRYNLIGTYQDDRYPAALDPSSVIIDNRSFEELIEYFIFMAKKMRFYDENPESSSNDWRPFFAQITTKDKHTGEVKLDLAKLRFVEESGEMQPHLALMLAFLKMYGIEQEGINSLTKRHLDFYYKEILRFAPKLGSVGNAVVEVKLNKTAHSAFIPVGTTFLAGKDNEGKNITYSNLYDYTAYPVTIEVMNMVDADKRLYIADSTNDNLCKFQCGFAISSPLLALKGLKTFELNIDVGTSNGIRAFYTTEDGWIEGSIKNKKVNISNAIIPYDDKTHQLGIETPYPVVFIAFNSIAELLSIVTVIPNVYKAEVKIPSEDIILRNKLGDVKNENGVQPFGSMPSVGDKCTILTPDVEGYISELKVSDNILWTKENSCVIDGSILTLQNDYGYGDYLKQLIIDTNKIAVLVKEEKDIDFNIVSAPKAPTLSTPINVSCTYTLQNNNKSLCFLRTPNMSEAISSYGDLEIACSLDRQVYIGIRGVVLGSSLNLYIELEKDGELNVKEKKLAPEWYVLKGNSWKNAEISKDQTRGLQNDGIIYIEFNDPEIFRHHNILSDELVWLRVNYNKAIRPNIKRITPNVIELVFDARSLGKGLTGTPLPKGTIAKLEHNIVGVKGVEQFCDGQEGKYTETELEFQTRVSERLRHKGRAVTKWDYERLVLQEFPFLAAAKCIPYGVKTGMETMGGVPKVPVTIVVVPKCPNKNDLEPRLSDIQLKKVKDFLEDKVSPFVEIQVVNPSYEPINVKCSIGVHKGNFGVENGDYATEIRNALIAYLAPWSDGKHGILMSNNYNESQIMLFLERLPYVDNVRYLSVSLNKTSILEGEDIIPSTPQGILTAGRDIEIKVINS